MKKWVVCSLLFYLGYASSLWAQAFQNPDFEDANLSPIPPGQFGGNVSIADALPYWTGYLGTNQVTQVLHNNVTLGSASIDVLGPYWNPSFILQGQYTVELQAGLNPFTGGGLVNASLAQIGLVSTNAKSIMLEAAGTGTNFTVSFAGQTISLSPVGSGPNYTLFGGDISSFAGQVGELRLSTLSPSGAGVLLDAVTFSTQAIPEPSGFSLAVTAVAGLGFRRLTSHRRRSCSMLTRKTAGAVVMLLCLICTSSLWAQGFQDLDFESAVLSNPGGTVNFGPAFPGWSGYAGTNRLDTVLYDRTFLDTTGISILDGNTPPFGVYGELIDGNYSAVLQAGVYSGFTPADVSLSQTGLVPLSTKSLSFYARPSSLAVSNFTVSLGGVNLTLISSPVPDTDFAFFQANVPAFGGSQKELKFTLLAQNPHVDNRFLSLDVIEFSPIAIPEPSSFGLLVAGVLGLFFWQRTHRRTMQ